LSKITILSIKSADRAISLSQYDSPFYWDISLSSLHRISDEKLVKAFDQPIDAKTVLSFVMEHCTGTVILDGLISKTGIGEELVYRLINLATYGPRELNLVLFSPTMEVPTELYPFVQIEKVPLPDAIAVQDLLLTFGLNDPALVPSCLGLSQGEIRILLNRLDLSDPETPPQSILDYKMGRLRSLGIQLLPKPDVEVAGLDNLNAILENARRLLTPEAAKHGLQFPKGVLMWGVPGSGKSLAAKHAASKMRVPLIVLDWGQVLSPVPGESEARLRYLLEVAETLSPCILYADDFDKAFASADLSQENSTERRIAGMLLTWMQDNGRPVYFMASVNRAEQMPPELLRRFTDIVFVDYPHEGQRKEVFDLHLKKYTHTLDATRIDWQQILRKYAYCTPAEIGQAVSKCAERAFFEGRPGAIAVADILEQRDKFVSGYTRDKASILRIQRNAELAVPATSQDGSEWKIEQSELFQGYLGGQRNG
jgi:ATPase family associated with various cellular activities (AAA)